MLARVAAVSVLFASVTACSGGAPPAPNGCIDSVSAGHHVFTCGGMHMDVEVPPQCSSPRACGLIADVHGLTMDAQMEDDNTNMRALGTKNGYIVVQPNAVGAPSLTTWDPSTQDDIFYDFLVTAISAFAVDPKRVHMMGFSDGGDATFRFLCKHADLFASVAPAAGEGCTFTGTDVPSREIPVFFLHGTMDRLDNYQTAGIPQRDQVVAGWNMGTGQVVQQGNGFVRTRWTSPQGTVFEWLTHDYASTNSTLVGHCYPGSTDPGGQPGQFFPFGCAPPNAFTWGEEAMAFFLAHH